MLGAPASPGAAGGGMAEKGLNAAAAGLSPGGGVAGVGGTREGACEAGPEMPPPTIGVGAALLSCGPGAVGRVVPACGVGVCGGGI